MRALGLARPRVCCPPLPAAVLDVGGPGGEGDRLALGHLVLRVGDEVVQLEVGVVGGRKTHRHWRLLPRPRLAD